MSRKKMPFGALSDSTQEKYISVNYSRAWDEEITEILTYGADTSHVYLALLPIARLGNGFLERNGQPLTSAKLARLTNIPQKTIGDALRNLVHCDAYGYLSGIYFAQRMVSHFRKVAKDNGKLAYVPESIRILMNLEQSGTKSADPVQSSTIHSSRCANIHEGKTEIDSSLDKMRPDIEAEGDKASLDESYLSSSSESNAADTARPSPASQDGASVSNLLCLSSDITPAWIDELRPKYPNINIGYAIQKCQAHYGPEGKGMGRLKAVTREAIIKWMDWEKPEKVNGNKHAPPAAPKTNGSDQEVREIEV